MFLLYDLFIIYHIYNLSILFTQINNSNQQENGQEAGHKTNVRASQYFELASHFKQSIEKMKLFTKVNSVQRLVAFLEKQHDIMHAEKVAELKKKEEILLKELDITGKSYFDLIWD